MNNRELRDNIMSQSPLSQVEPIIAKDCIRTQFSKAMSDMYRLEVPAYGALLDLVISSNNRYLENNSEMVTQLQQVENIDKNIDKKVETIDKKLINKLKQSIKTLIKQLKQ